MISTVGTWISTAVTTVSAGRRMVRVYMPPCSMCSVTNGVCGTCSSTSVRRRTLSMASGVDGSSRVWSGMISDTSLARCCDVQHARGIDRDIVQLAAGRAQDDERRLLDLGHRLNEIPTHRREELIEEDG